MNDLKIVFHPRILSLCAWLCLGPRLIRGVFLSCSPSLFFWDRVSCWIWSSWILLSCLASELQESVCLQATRHPRMDYRNHIAVPDFLHLSSEDSDSAPRVCLASTLQKASSPQLWLGSSCPVGLCSFLYSSVVESVSQASRYHVGKENNARSPPLQSWLWRTRLNSGRYKQHMGLMGWVILLCSVVINGWMIKKEAEGSVFMDIVILRKDSVTPLLGDKKTNVPEMGYESLLSTVCRWRKNPSPLWCGHRK